MQIRIKALKVKEGRPAKSWAFLFMSFLAEHFTGVAVRAYLPIAGVAIEFASLEQFAHNRRRFPIEITRISLSSRLRKVRFHSFVRHYRNSCLRNSFPTAYNCHGTLWHQADSSVLLSTVYLDGCYDTADRYMIERSDLLLVVGRLTSGLYGIRYAKEQGVPVETIALM